MRTATTTTGGGGGRRLLSSLLPLLLVVQALLPCTQAVTIPVSTAPASDEDHTNTYFINIPVDPALIQQSIGPILKPSVLLNTSWITFEVFRLDFVKIKTLGVWVNFVIDSWVVKAKTYVTADGYPNGQFILAMVFSDNRGLLTWAGCKVASPSLNCAHADSLTNTISGGSINTDMSVKLKDKGARLSANLNVSSSAPSKDLYDFIFDHFKAAYFYDGTTTSYWNATTARVTPVEQVKSYEALSFYSNIVTNVLSQFEPFDESDIDNILFMPVSFNIVNNNDSPSLSATVAFPLLVISILCMLLL